VLTPLLLLLSCDVPGDSSSGAAARPLPEFEEWADGPDGPRVQAIGDLRQRSGGRMHVTMRFENLPDYMDDFRILGKNEELVYSNFRFFTEDGGEIGFDKDGRSLKLSGRHHDVVVADYDVKPGGNGRHGHQGIVEDDFALFDGRVFIQPVGSGDLVGARARFLAPEGWSTVGALTEDDGWQVYDTYGPQAVRVSLELSCFGVGPFEGTVKKLGKSDVRVYNYAGWDQKVRDDLTADTMAIYDWFYEDLGFDPGFPLAMVWSPKASDGGKIYGGSSANGTCFQQPAPDTRAWQLMAHRLGHSMNKYVPSGMHLKDLRDDWFKEGWPSYIELMATVGSGVEDSAPRWNRLYRDYTRIRAEHPDRDMSMLDEPKARGEATEYMHYFKGPMVVMMLDDWIRRRYGKDLTVFMKQMWVKYGQYNQPMPLRDELEAFVGTSLDDFWALHADQRGWVYPVWDEALTPQVTQRATLAGVATVGGRPVSADYLHFLAATGDFEYFSDIVDFLEREEPRRAQLAAAGIQLLPPKLDAVRAGLDPMARYSVERAELAYDLGTPVGKPTEDQRLVWTEGDEVAAVFQQLLDDEQRYLQTVMHAGVEAIELQAKDKEGEWSRGKLLTFGKRDEIRLQTRWFQQAGSVTIKARRGDDTMGERTPTIWPDWLRSWSPFSQGQLPKTDGVVTFEVTTKDGRSAARSFWRRD